MAGRSKPRTYNGDARATSGGVNAALDLSRGRRRRAKGCEAMAHAIRMPRGDDHMARTARQAREQAESALRERLGGDPIQPYHFLQLDRVYHAAVGLMVGYSKLSEIGYLREKTEVRTVTKGPAGETVSLRVENDPVFQPLVKDIDRLHNQLADAYGKLGIDKLDERKASFLDMPHVPSPNVDAPAGEQCDVRDNADTLDVDAEADATGDVRASDAKTTKDGELT